MEANGDLFFKTLKNVCVFEVQGSIQVLYNIYFSCSGCQPLLFLHNYLPLWGPGNLRSGCTSLSHASDLVSVLTAVGLCANREEIRLLDLMG